MPDIQDEEVPTPPGAAVLEKWCPRCEAQRPRGEFGNSRRTKDGISVYCRPCNVKNVKEWRERNRKVQSFRTWRHKLKTKYGITPEVFYLMQERQGGLCAICLVPFGDDVTNCCVDHCHETGLTRALLCKLCNMGIGAFREKKESMERAIQYLAHYEQHYRKAA
jgi:hypothetical protein